jgi:hypothetical protein
MRKLFSIFLLLWAASACAQTVPVTAKLTDGSGNPVPGAYLHFELYNCGNNYPSVRSAGLVVVQRSFDLQPNSAGIVSGVITPNDLILCGNVTSTLWTVTLMKSGAIPLNAAQRYNICSSTESGPPCAQSSRGAAFDPSSAQPAQVVSGLVNYIPQPPGYILLFANPNNNQTWQQPLGTTGYFKGMFDFSGATVTGLPSGGGGGGGSSTPNPYVSFTNALSVNLATGLNTPALIPACWDSNNNWFFPASAHQNPSTSVVTFTFATNQSGICGVNGTGGGSGGGGSGPLLNGTQYVGLGTNSNIATTVVNAGTNNDIVIPANYLGTDSFPYVNTFNAPIRDNRFGVASNPANHLSYANNSEFFQLFDASPVSNDNCCGWGGPPGVGNAAPMVHYHLTESGAANAMPLMVESEWASGATGFQIGFDFATIADSGSLPQQFSNVFVLADNSGWTINSCTLVTGVDTCSLLGATLTAGQQAALAGNGVYVSGNSAANTGGVTGVITGTTGTTITFTNANQVGSGGPVSGGTIAPNHLAWGTEWNIFNNNHDPGATTPTSAQNVFPFHGLTVTPSGTFPLSEAFYGGGGAYATFRSDNAITADFMAGTPVVGGPLLSIVGFEARPRQVATAGNNYPSKAIALDMSGWNGSSYSESQNLIKRTPQSSATNSAGQLSFITPLTTVNLLDSGQWLPPNQTVAAPAYSFAGNPTSGFGIDVGAQPEVSVNGVEVASFSGVGMNALSISTGSGAGGTVNLGYLLMNGSAPTCTFTSGGGTSPTCTLDTGSANGAGIIIATTGTGSPAATGTITLFFNGTMGNHNPVCQYEASDNVGAWQALAVFKDKGPSTSSDLFTWTNGVTPTALTASTAYWINYQCVAK